MTVIYPYTTRLWGACMRAMSWEYLAGFFDGEGSISVVTRKVESTSCVTVSVGQSSDLDGKPPEVITAISTFFTEHGIRHGVYEDQKANGRVGTLPDGREIVTRRRVFDIQIFNRAGVEKCLRGLVPYLYVKRVKAEDVLRFLLLYPDQRGRHSQPDKGLDNMLLQADRAAGLTYKQIAAKYHVSVTAVYERINNEAATKYRHEWRAAKRAVLAQES